MRILQVSTHDEGGGAERVAANLHHSYRQRGHDSWLAVGTKHGRDPRVVEIPNAKFVSQWFKRCSLIREGAIRRGIHIVPRLALWLGLLDRQERRRYYRWRQGFEDFEFPGTASLLRLTPEPPEILHAHNLHGGYFDLRRLPELCKTVPVALTLHDAWLLSGHCAHSLACERWKSGCGNCPDLSLYPGVMADRTAENWRRKRDIFSQCRLWIISPSQWLIDKARQSLLAGAAIETRVIPNGIDLSVFSPGGQAAAREKLGLPKAAKVLVFGARGIKQNPYKDYRTLREAFARAAALLPDQTLILLALGESSPTETIRPGAEIRFVPFISDPRAVADYYRAANAYIHAARAETFPNVILEAMACGTPVIASAVGGVPEQVADGQNGLLAPPGEPDSMARQIQRLLSEPGLFRALSDWAASTAKRFDLDRQVSTYLALYTEMLQSHRNALS
jgi:glycosyltransferase involved in cell wall biosynthesis